MNTAINRSARVGIITDQTGAISFMGIANTNVAKMLIDDINARGGLLGRPVELFIEDSATDDSVAAAVASKLVEQAQVDVVVGGIFSSTRQAIKGPVVDEANRLYIYPEQYEGQECHPLIFCTGPVPAQQVEPLFPWLMEQTGAKKFYMPSADYIWPHTMNKKVREVVTERGGEIVGEEYFPLDHMEYEWVVADIMASGADVVFNTIVPPGLTPFLEQLHRAGFTARGGHIVCTYFDENFLNLVPAEHVEGLYGCLDYYRDVKDPFSIELLNRYEALFPGSAMFTAGSACSGTYRALKLWEAIGGKIVVRPQPAHGVEQLRDYLYRLWECGGAPSQSSEGRRNNTDRGCDFGRRSGLLQLHYRVAQLVLLVVGNSPLWVARSAVQH